MLRVVCKICIEKYLNYTGLFNRKFDYIIKESNHLMIKCKIKKKSYYDFLNYF